MKVAFGESKLTSDKLHDITEKINHYMVIKTYISLGTGILVTTWLTILKVDYAILWGILAFMFNFVPNVGSIIAAIPAVLLAVVQWGPGTALLAAGGYILINVGIGNFVEPRLMGSKLGLSPLVVFLSLVFWFWVLGPVGMLLSVPLTMTMKIALSSSEETAWISTLLGGAVKVKK
jgi:predicted PurR-regulated permease PerM